MLPFLSSSLTHSTSLPAALSKSDYPNVRFWKKRDWDTHGKVDKDILRIEEKPIT
jgi:hypothetical protein